MSVSQAEVTKAQEILRAVNEHWSELAEKCP